ncbi:heterokaryon incompatibility protein [Stagonosporopsis vannaccii]|nr:heterokaryon incompatibility protein [Stagonosporopsis vannaccii]
MEDSLDNDKDVTPYQLCVFCKRLFDVYTSKKFWKSYSEDAAGTQSRASAAEEAPWCFDSYTGPRFNGPRLDFHDSLPQFLKSVELGCHICSLFRRKPTIFDFACMEMGELELFPSTCRNTRSQGCQRIQIRPWLAGVEAGGILIADPIVMHRHALGNESVQCDIGNVLPHSESLEDQYRWCSTTSSTTGFEMLNAWLQQCVTQHDSCRSKLTTDQTGPTRLLDLEAFSASKDVQLVECIALASELYATLSYRWGGTNPVTLTRKNYDQLKAHIRLKDLPRTIREAIGVCRALHVRYLWIDSLCIIQDGGEDFVREIANMGSIYAGSYFTIAAADSLNCESGLFRNRSPLHRQHCVIDSKHARWVFQCTHISCGWHDTNIRFASLSERGWVFQEQILSPRTVHFTREEILWECRERLFCHGCVNSRGSQPTYDTAANMLWLLREEVLCGKRRSLDQPYSDILWSHGKQAITQLLQQLSGMSKNHVFQTVWRTILERYSATNLTKIDDRLSALAGIAQVIENNLHYTASYGLWLEFFLNQLLWSQSRPPEKLASIYEQLPSWSWISTPETVKIFRGYESDKEVQMASIMRHPPITGFQPLFGLLAQGPQPVSFTVHGPLRPCQAYPFLHHTNYDWTITPTPEELSDRVETLIQSLWDTYLLNNKGDREHITGLKQRFEYRSNLIFYADRQLYTREKLFCLLLKRTIAQTGTIVDRGLVLRQISSTDSMYKRVGYFEEHSDQFDVRSFCGPFEAQGIPGLSLINDAKISRLKNGSPAYDATLDPTDTQSVGRERLSQNPEARNDRKATSSSFSIIDVAEATHPSSVISKTAETINTGGTASTSEFPMELGLDVSSIDTLKVQALRDARLSLETPAEVRRAAQIADFIFFNGSETYVEINIV